MSKRPKAKARKAGGPASPTIAAGEFKAICLELMDKVKERNAEYIVTKRGKPVARLAPVDSAPQTPFGFMRGTVLEARDIVGPDAEAWEESTTDPLLGG